MTTAFPKIPTNEFTLMINGWITDYIVNNFLKFNLPEYGHKTTSGYRDFERNLKAGGAKLSAHLYNLARDKVLLEPNTNAVMSDKGMRELYEARIKPNWDDYSSFTPTQKNTSSGWIHLNVDRQISKFTNYAGIAATIGIGTYGFKKFFLKGKSKNG